MRRNRVIWIAVALSFTSIILVFEATKQNWLYTPNMMQQREQKEKAGNNNNQTGLLLNESSVHTGASRQETNGLATASSSGTESTSPSITAALPQTPVDVILFFHIAKTGGTTIREFFKKLPNVEHKLVSFPRQVAPSFQRMHKWLCHDNINQSQKTLVIEIHGSVYLPQYSQRWQNVRNTAAAHNRSAFSLTIVREPISFHKSYFRFFHRAGCKFSWCAKQRFRNMTEENLIQVARENHQAQILVGRTIRTPHELLDLQTNLTQTFDWIGTTDQLSYTTLPLLSAILTNGTRTWSNHTVGASAQVQIHNQTVLAMLQERSKYDRMLYDWVSSTYTLPEQ